MSPKPQVGLSPSSKRLSVGRKAVTIVLGLKTPQGVVLAADTQESYAGSHKVNRPKLFYKSENNLCDLPIGLAVAGAGFGPWLDKISMAMWDTVQDATNLDEACSKVEDEIKKRYDEYRQILNSSIDSELIYGVGVAGGTRLFHAWGPIVNEVHARAAGSGQAIADFLLRHFKQTTHITNAMALAVYILYSAKEHAEGCGGNSHLAVLQDDGESYLLDHPQISAMEDLVKSSSRATDVFLMFAANPVVTPDGVKAAGAIVSELLAEEISELQGVKSIRDLLARLDKKPV
jgi:20S proteasome alpha/beta subunit